MGSAFHQLCPRYSGTLTPTAPTAIRLWETFIFTFTSTTTQLSLRLVCLHILILSTLLVCRELYKQLHRKVHMMCMPSLAGIFSLFALVVFLLFSIIIFLRIPKDWYIFWDTSEDTVWMLLLRKQDWMCLLTDFPVRHFMSNSDSL